MNRILILIACLLTLAVSIAFGQIPNPGFEQWSSNEPVGWLTTNVQGVVVPVTQSATARSGSSAIKGTMLSFSSSIYAPWVYSNPFRVTARHASLTGYYQFVPSGSNEFYVLVFMYNNVSGFIGAGSLETVTAAASYTPLNIPITYFLGETPDSCFIWFGTTDSSTTPVAGSNFLLDDLAFSGLVSVDDVHRVTTSPTNFLLLQNYPNPFNPTTTIEYDLPSDMEGSLIVYDMFGREISMLASGKLAAGKQKVVWDASSLPSGMYFCRLRAGKLSETRKLILTK